MIGVNDTIATSLSGASLMCIPASIGLALLAGPIISMIFIRVRIRSPRFNGPPPLWSFNVSGFYLFPPNALGLKPSMPSKTIEAP